MNSSAEPTRLPTWVFIITDLAFIGAAGLIAGLSARPLSSTAVLGVVGCLGLGVIVGLVPLVLRLERQKNEALDERQREIEALARTVSSSAEQISIVANGLHEIVEVAQKNLRHADQLPHKLQEKIAEFQAQLSVAEDAEKEELERELLSLRTTESERLESVSQRIAKSAAEWAKLEAATQQHLNAANEAVGKLAMGTANAIGKAQAAAEQAMAHARVEAARFVADAGIQATRAIESAKASALADLETRIVAAITTGAQRIAGDLNTAFHIVEPMPIASTESTPPLVSEVTTSDTAPPFAVAPAAGPKPEPAATPKRPRKPRREEAPPAAADPSAPPPAPAAPSPEETPTGTDGPTASEPAPMPPDRISEITPVAPHTAVPFPHLTANGGLTAVPPPAAGSPPLAPVVILEQPHAPAPAAPPARKRAAKKPEPVDNPDLPLDLPDSPPQSGLVERVLTSDGATRLIVTAYIGIGNRLFIRGSGAGLTWDRGVPLQFVSIGKWRWETNDASQPVSFKLYKNDDIECASLGEQTLEPGHQQEVTAAF